MTSTQVPNKTLNWELHFCFLITTQGESMRLLTLPQIKELTQLSTAGIYRLMSQGKFPKQIKIAERSSHWIESEIMDFITEKMEERS